MTLAEVMLIILFALLLLLGRQSADLDKATAIQQQYSAILEAGWSQNMTANEVDSLTNLIEETEKHQKPEEEISDTWQTLTSNLEEERENPVENEIDELLTELDEAKQAVEEARRGTRQS